MSRRWTQTNCVGADGKKKKENIYYVAPPARVTRRQRRLKIQSIFHLRSRIAATSHLEPVKAEVYDQSRHTCWLASAA